MSGEVFDQSVIDSATMTTEQQTLAALGKCFKCDKFTLEEAIAEEDYFWMQCGICDTIYVLKRFSE